MSFGLRVVGLVITLFEVYLQKKKKVLLQLHMEYMLALSVQWC